MSVLAESSASTLRIVADFRDCPVPRHLSRAAVWLVEADYTPNAIISILEHLARFGTAVGCVWVDPEHRDILEETLPMDAGWNDPVWDSFTWELGPQG